MKKADYSEGGCKDSDMPGFACMICEDEGIVIWMYGLNEEIGCECFTPKTKGKLL